jgi:hypothetical protein
MLCKINTKHFLFYGIFTVMIQCGYPDHPNPNAAFKKKFSSFNSVAYA